MCRPSPRGASHESVRHARWAMAMVVRPLTVQLTECYGGNWNCTGMLLAPVQHRVRVRVGQIVGSPETRFVVAFASTMTLTLDFAA